MQLARHPETAESKESEHSDSLRILSKMTNHEQEPSLRRLQMRMIHARNDEWRPAGASNYLNGRWGILYR
jgi:hypothetical protein